MIRTFSYGTGILNFFIINVRKIDREVDLHSLKHEQGQTVSDPQ